MTETAPARRALALAAWTVAALAAMTTTASAQQLPEESDYQTPRSVAMGSGARASALSTSALTHNPAALGFGSLYHVESLVSYHASSSGWSIGGAAVDSVTSTVAAGMSFRGVFNYGKADYDGYDGRLGLALPLGDMLSIGVSGRYLKLEPSGQSGDRGPAGRQGVKGFTMDASIAFRPVESFQIAALGTNLIDHDSSLTPMRVGGGASVSIADQFTAAGEGLVDLSTYDEPTVIAGGGLEYFAAGMVPIRAGYRFDSGRQKHSVTGGLGYVDEEISVDLSLRQDVKGGAGGGKDTRVLLGFRYHVQ